MMSMNNSSKTKECVECKGEIPSTKRSVAKYCSVGCRQKVADRKYVEKHGKTHRQEWHFKKQYGLSASALNVMKSEQDYRCFICKKHESELSSGLYVDHCHETGAVRKLLCQRCNSALGFLDDDIDKAMALVSYLVEHKGSDLT